VECSGLDYYSSLSPGWTGEEQSCSNVKSSAALMTSRLVRWIVSGGVLLLRVWQASLIQDRWSALSQGAGKPHSIAGTILRRPVALYIVES
jgi:hypothetical protein